MGPIHQPDLARWGGFAEEREGGKISLLAQMQSQSVLMGATAWNQK
jgi:hypothetical protein